MKRFDAQTGRGRATEGTSPEKKSGTGRSILVGAELEVCIAEVDGDDLLIGERRSMTTPPQSRVGLNHPVVAVNQKV